MNLIRRWQWWTAVLVFPSAAYAVARIVPYSEAFPFFVLFVYATAAAAWWNDWQAGAVAFAFGVALVIQGWHLTPAVLVRLFINCTMIPWVLYFVERLKRARRAEEAVIRARLVADLSHELNSPLEAAIQAAYLMRGECRTDAGRQYAEIAISEIERASRVAKQAVRTAEQK